MVQKRAQRSKVFISYSHRDADWLEELQVHLRPLERQGVLSRWDDTLIKSGSLWKEEIERALSEAKVAVLLVSKHFLASQFIVEDELPPLLSAAKGEGAVIIPVILSPCRFSATDGISDYQAINSPDKSMSELGESERDRVWVNLTYAIEKALKESEQESRERTVDGKGTGPKKRDETRPRKREGPSTVGDANPDIVLFIREEHVKGQLTLTFQIKAWDEQLGVDDKVFGPVFLRIDPEMYFREFFGAIQGLQPHSTEEKEIAQKRLEAKGAHLFQALIPAELQAILLELVGKVTTFQIHSGDTWIPWELLKLNSYKAGRWASGPFLCEAFALTRWISGIHEEMHLPCQKIGIVAPRDSQLPASREECEYLLSLADDGRHVEELEPSFLSVIREMSKGRYDGLHFACHGDERGADPNLWGIFLERNQRLTPEDLYGEARNLGLARPLVFLNGCYTGRGALSLTAMGGWATQFLGAGAGAFIGSHWAILDEQAASLAKSFYEHFVTGSPIGEAIKQARLNIRTPGDPSWLAYIVFANPLTVCRGESRA